eukprot:6172695-Pleurochrysis_carterae.AAC.1
MLPGIGAIWWLLLSAMVDTKDEYQLCNFIVGLRVSQFVTLGLGAAAHGCFLVTSRTRAKERPLLEHGLGWSCSEVRGSGMEVVRYFRGSCAELACCSARTCAQYLPKAPGMRVNYACGHSLYSRMHACTLSL